MSVSLICQSPSFKSLRINFATTKIPYPEHNPWCESSTTHSQFTNDTIFLNLSYRKAAHRAVFPRQTTAISRFFPELIEPILLLFLSPTRQTSCLPIRKQTSRERITTLPSHRHGSKPPPVTGCAVASSF